jgi:hypothetical protein
MWPHAVCCGGRRSHNWVSFQHPVRGEGVPQQHIDVRVSPRPSPVPVPYRFPLTHLSLAPLTCPRRYARHRRRCSPCTSSSASSGTRAHRLRRSGGRLRREAPRAHVAGGGGGGGHGGVVVVGRPVHARAHHGGGGGDGGARCVLPPRCVLAPPLPSPASARLSPWAAYPWAERRAESEGDSNGHTEGSMSQVCPRRRRRAPATQATSPSPPPLGEPWWTGC